MRELVTVAVDIPINHSLTALLGLFGSILDITFSHAGCKKDLAYCNGKVMVPDACPSGRERCGLHDKQRCRNLLALGLFGMTSVGLIPCRNILYHTETPNDGRRSPQ